MLTLEQLLQLQQNGGFTGNPNEHPYSDPGAAELDPAFVPSAKYDAKMRLAQSGGLNPTEQYNSIMGAGQNGVHMQSILNRGGYDQQDPANWAALGSMLGQGYKDPITHQWVGPQRNQNQQG